MNKILYVGIILFVYIWAYKLGESDGDRMSDYKYEWR